MTRTRSDAKPCFSDGARARDSEAAYFY